MILGENAHFCHAWTNFGQSENFLKNQVMLLPQLHAVFENSTKHTSERTRVILPDIREEWDSIPCNRGHITIHHPSRALSQ